MRTANILRKICVFNNSIRLLYSKSASHLHSALGAAATVTTTNQTRGMLSSSTRGPLYNNEWSEGNEERREMEGGTPHHTDASHTFVYNTYTNHQREPAPVARNPSTYHRPMARQVGKPGGSELNVYPILLSPLFFCLRGGVTGRPVFAPYGYFAFFSAGFRIWKEHSNVSSTLIIAPALSNSPQ